MITRFFQLFLVLSVWLLVAGCASLPEVQPRMQANDGQKPSVSGARGVLSKQATEKVLARLKQAGGDSDVIALHLAFEEEIAGEPLIVGNEVSLLIDGPATYRALFGAIEKARDHVNVEFYIIEDGEVGQRFADLLLKKRAQGVAVNLMYDSVGSLPTKKEYFDRLRAGGVQVLEYNPVNPLQARKGWELNSRNHRKVVVVDGEIAFTGGINISNVYSRGSSPGSSGGSSSRASGSGSSVGWRDTHVRITGPVVAQLQKQFLATWEKQQGDALEMRNWYPELKRTGRHPVRVITSSPDDDSPAIFYAFVSAITHAQKSVHLTMAYFAPDVQTIEALKDAAKRGVDVKMVLPSHTDVWAVFHAGRSHYADLLEAGVQIYERSEAVLHAKTVVIDGVWSTVGSSNMDWRSFLHNDELNIVVLGSEFAGQMNALFERDLAASARVEKEEWARRPVKFRMLEWAARVWEYWL